MIFFSWAVDLSNLYVFFSFSLLELDCLLVCLICIIQFSNGYHVVNQKLLYILFDFEVHVIEKYTIVTVHCSDTPDLHPWKLVSVFLFLSCCDSIVVCHCCMVAFFFGRSASFCFILCLSLRYLLPRVRVYTWLSWLWLYFVTLLKVESVQFSWYNGDK